MLDWKSPLKADMMYRNRQPLLTEPDFRPKRVGFSYKRKEPGTISPDITIVEDRNKAPTIDNLFAIVEVKFPGDAFNRDQEDGYEENFTGVPLALIRVPEDCDCTAHDQNSRSNKDEDQDEERRQKKRRRRWGILEAIFG